MLNALANIFVKTCKKHAIFAKCWLTSVVNSLCVCSVIEFDQQQQFNDYRNAVTLSYVHHPVDDIEPMQESELHEASMMFLRIWGWINDGSNFQARGMRCHIVLMVLFPHLGCPDGDDYTNESIGSYYNLTRQAVNKVVCDFRDQFPTLNIKNRSMRSEETRVICRNSQQQTNRSHKPTNKSNKYASRMSKLNSLLTTH